VGEKCVKKRRAGTWHVWSTADVRTFLVRKPERGRVHVENLGVDGRIILKLLLQKLVCMTWSGYIWLTTRTSGGLLRTR
jgi:hypothetical protein